MGFSILSFAILYFPILNTFKETNLMVHFQFLFNFVSGLKRKHGHP